MPNKILMDIEIDGLQEHASNTSHTGKDFYWPHITKISSIKLAKTLGGYVSIDQGSYSLICNPNDSNTIFSYSKSRWPIPRKPLKTIINFGDLTGAICMGSSVLRKYNVVNLEADFDLIPPKDLNKDALYLTLNDNNFAVTQCSNTNPMVITAPGHSFISGNKVIFEDLNLTTQLNWNPTERNAYPVTRIDADTFTLDEVDGSTGFTTGVNSSGRVGLPVSRSRAFGKINFRIPIKKMANQLSNPHFNMSLPIDIEEDGLFIYHPLSITAEKLNLSTSPTGELSLSGTSAHGTTLKDFFTWVCAELGLSLDVSLAPAAETQNVAFYVDQQMQIIELAGKVSESFDCCFWITGTTLFLNDLHFRPTPKVVSITIQDGSEITFEFPIKSISTEYLARVPIVGATKTLGEEKRIAVESDDIFVDVGNSMSVEIFVENRNEFAEILKRRIKTLNMPKAKLTIKEIKQSSLFGLGDRLVYSDTQNVLKVDMMVRSIEFDLENNSVTYGGECEESLISHA